MQSETLSADAASTALAPLDAHLNSASDLLRTSAIRALAVLPEGSRTDARAYLLTALLDPYPDVRSDAMEALALAEDAAAFVRSSAFQILAGLQATDAIARGLQDDRRALIVLQGLAGGAGPGVGIGQARQVRRRSS